MALPPQLTACPRIRGEVRLDQARQASRAKEAEERSQRGTVIMRRLITMLAAALLAAATLLATVGAASAGATTAGHATSDLGLCPRVTIRAMPTKFMVGTPNIATSGSAAILRTRVNRTTTWLSCGTSTSGVRSFISVNGLLALTSRSLTPGADVTLTPRHGINGFASQRWTRVVITPGSVFRYQNVKTHLWLRVRNSGPAGFQTVTTGNTATNWVVRSP
jgi:hypothetical protein